MTTRDICIQIASAGLLDDELENAIRRGGDFDLQEVVRSLVYTSLDAQVTIKNDPDSTWNEKRLAIACLVIAFLSALSLVDTRNNLSGRDSEGLTES